MRAYFVAIAVAVLVAPSLPAQSATAAARAAIDAGNQAWVDGVKAGDVQRILATYTPDAVDCGPTGECERGLKQIEQHMTSQLASLGRARSAHVTTWGSSQHGNFVYEWGQAEAEFEGGKKLMDKYLTVWQHGPDGSWKIFRNMVIPD